ncbi:MAG: hypothetical protein RR087_00655 [Oscillospiraceae bacterium]
MEIKEDYSPLENSKHAKKSADISAGENGTAIISFSSGKPLSADELTETKEKPKKQKRKFGILLYNFLSTTVGNVIKTVLIISVTLVGSLALTVIFTALMQDRPATDILYETLNKLSQIIK